MNEMANLVCNSAAWNKEVVHLMDAYMLVHDHEAQLVSFLAHTRAFRHKDVRLFSVIVRSKLLCKCKGWVYARAFMQLMFPEQD